MMKEVILKTAPLPIIETHCHLDMLKLKMIDEVLAMSKVANVEKIITIATAPENLQTVIALSHKYPQVFCTQGIHPHAALHYTEDTTAAIQNNYSLHKNRIVAIGEIGLDYYYENSPKDAQKSAFERQLELASSLHLPVVIHTREADHDTKEILMKFPKIKGVIHSFTSSMELLEFALDAGLYIGFNGIITFKNSPNVVKLLERALLSQIIIETDAPFLTPVPYRGHENGPYFLPFIAEKIAEIKKCPIEEVLATCYTNSQNLFFDANSFLKT